MAARENAMWFNMEHIDNATISDLTHVILYVITQFADSTSLDLT